MAVERFLDMFEARLHRDAMTGQKGALRGRTRETLKCGEAVERS
jgi:hypothetical protein